jgi:hypothetical protein
MESQWYEIEWFNFTKAILHGRHGAGADEREIEQVLTGEQRNQVHNMNERHKHEKMVLLRSFVQ